jgi:hypothetical protein
MSEIQSKQLLEIHEMLKLLVDENRQLVEDIRELKDEQKKIHEEIKMSNIVLHNIGIRNEIVN